MSSVLQRIAERVEQGLESLRADGARCWLGDSRLPRRELLEIPDVRAHWSLLQISGFMAE